MYLPSDSTELVNRLVYLYQRTKEELSDYREEALGYYNLYDSWVDDDYPLRFDTFIPVPYSVIETILPRFMTGLMYRFPLMQVVPTHPMTPRESVMSASRLLNKKWMTDRDTWFDLLMMGKESLITGTAAGKVCFTRRKRRIPQFEPVLVNGEKYGSVKKYLEVNEVNRPQLIHRDIFDVYPDLEAPTPGKMRFVFDAFIKDMDELRHGEIEYKNLNELEEEGNWNPDYEIESTRRKQDMDSHSVYTSSPDYFKPRHILECTFREWTREGEVIRVITIGNMKVLLRNEIIRVWPWQFLVNNPRPHELLGSSELKPIKSLTLTINDLVNMGLENMLMSLTKMWVVGDDAEADLNQFVLEPMNVIQVTDINQIKTESWADINPSVLKFQEMIMQSANLATGIQDTQRGASPSRKEFATTVLALQQAAEARIDFKIKLFERTWLAPLARTYVEMAQQYLDEPEYVPDPESETGFSEIDMYQLQGLMDFETHASAMGAKELQRASLNDFAVTLSSLMPEAPPEVRLKLARSIADTYDGLEEFVEELVKLEGQGQPQPGIPAEGAPGGAFPGGGASSPPGLAGLAEAFANSQAAAVPPNAGAGGMEPLLPLL